MARGAAFDDRPRVPHRPGHRRRDAGVGQHHDAGADHQHPAPPGLGPRAGDLRRGPFLLGRLGSAFVAGVQEYVAACAKHYAANNIENGRGSANAMMDEQTLREIYARHFEMMIRGRRRRLRSWRRTTWSTARKSTQNSHLLTDILRDRLRLPGLRALRLVGDAERRQPATMPQRRSRRPPSQAVNAGLDMELPWRYNYSTLTTAVAGRVAARRRI